jgi:hypothetical protein
VGRGCGDAIAAGFLLGRGAPCTRSVVGADDSLRVPTTQVRALPCASTSTATSTTTSTTTALTAKATANTTTTTTTAATPTIPPPLPLPPRKPPYEHAHSNMARKRTTVNRSRRATHRAGQIQGHQRVGHQQHVKQAGHRIQVRQGVRKPRQQPRQCKVRLGLRGARGAGGTMVGGGAGRATRWRGGVCAHCAGRWVANHKGSAVRAHTHTHTQVQGAGARAAVPPRPPRNQRPAR